jgi:hypothetical protein
MSDDQYFRLFLTIAVAGVFSVFRVPIMRCLHKIGYRDWRDPSKPPEKM